MKKLIVLLGLMIISLLSYSQSTYPKLSLIDSDTIVWITPLQLTKTLLIFNERDMYRELYDSLSSVVVDYQVQMDGRDELIEGILKDSNNKDLQLIEYNKQVIEKQSEGNIKLYKGICIGVGITTIFALILK